MFSILQKLVLNKILKAMVSGKKNPLGKKIIIRRYLVSFAKCVRRLIL